MKLIAFEFCDNDFHGPLQEAIKFISDNHFIVEIPLEKLKAMTVASMQAFDTLRDIAQDRDLRDHTDYFNKTLTVSEPQNTGVAEGEGYIYNGYTSKTSYYGY